MTTNESKTRTGVPEQVANRTTQADFQGWLSAFRFPLEDLKRVRDRLMVVVALNGSRRSPSDPGRPRFVRLSNRRDVDPGYLAQFDDDLPIDFDELVQTIPPGISYISEKQGRFQVSIPVPYREAGAYAGQVPASQDVLRREHFLFRFGSGEKLSGEQAFRTVCDALRQVASTLGDAPRLLRVFSGFLNYCATFERMPAYGFGEPLPDGMRELVNKLLWCERDDLGVDLSEVRLRGKWADVPLETLQDLLAAFRDAVIGRNADQYGRYRLLDGAGPIELAQRAAREEGVDLVERFRLARKAFNELRQMLRSPTYLSLILEWAVCEIYRSLDLYSPTATHEENQGVQEAIARGVPGTIAPPIERPLEADRERILGRIERIADAATRLVLGLPPDQAPEEEGLGDAPERIAAELQTAGAQEGLAALLSHQGAAERLRRIVRSFVRSRVAPHFFLEPGLDQSTVRALAAEDLEHCLFVALTQGAESARQLAETARQLGEQCFGKERRGDAARAVEEAVYQLGAGAVHATFSTELRARLEILAAVGEFERLSVKTLPASDPVPFLGAGAVVEPRPFLKETVQGRLGGLVERALADEDNDADADLALPDQDDLGHRVRDSIVATRAELGPDEPATELVPQVVRRLQADEQAERHVHGRLSQRNEALRLVYESYNLTDDDEARRRIERMTLSSLILLEPELLQLGSETTNLFQLLLDLLLEVDRNTLDLRPFLRRHPLTEYFDLEKHLSDGGVAELRQRLERQGSRNFSQVVDIVSDVRGLQFLCDELQNSPTAEIVVVHATAGELQAWLAGRNLEAGCEGPLLRAGLLVDDPKLQPHAVHPALVYLTNSATGGEDVAAVEQLAQLELRSQAASIVLPPFLFSGKVDGQGSGWLQEARKVLDAAEQVPAAVHVAGPSPMLGQAQHPASIHVPAGYLVCARLLNGGVESIRAHAPKFVKVPDDLPPRLHVIGRQAVDLRKGLEQVLHGDLTPDGRWQLPWLGSDYFQYIVLLIDETLRARSAGELPQGALVEALRWRENDPGATRSAGEILREVLLRGTSLDYAFGQVNSESIEVRTTKGAGSRVQQTADNKWFQIARSKLAPSPSRKRDSTSQSNSRTR